MNDIISFAEKIIQMPECQSLTPKEIAEIVFSYPFRIKPYDIFQKNEDLLYKYIRQRWNLAL